MQLTQAQVLALAPDAASSKAAQGLLKPAQWSGLGATPQAVWGACQGSGSKPYQTQVDLSAATPSFKCSCPSRKFPCKHGLALLLLQVQQPALFQEQAMPEWVSQWLQGRAEKAQKKEEKERAQTARAAELAAELAADPEAAAAQAQAAAAKAEKTQRQRWARIEAGVADLRAWLRDRVSHGLGNLQAEDRAQWHTQAARLVDAQAPLLGQRLRDAAALIHQGPYWPERLLAALGMLQLACDAVARREQLSPEELADLRSLALGWPLDKAQVLATQPPVSDDWLVLGQILQEREARLVERRVWLQGRCSGRMALLLEHSVAGKGFESSWISGQSVAASLVFYPSAAPLRALLLELLEVAPPGDKPLASAPLPAGSKAEHTAHTDAWTYLAHQAAACPWMPLHPWYSHTATIVRTAEGLAVIDAGRQAPLKVDEQQGWTLLALGGGHPISMYAEWDGQSLRPLRAQAPGPQGGIWYA